jgi:hypothetical protein
MCLSDLCRAETLGVSTFHAVEFSKTEPLLRWA